MSKIQNEIKKSEESTVNEQLTYQVNPLMQNKKILLTDSSTEGDSFYLFKPTDKIPTILNKNEKKKEPIEDDNEEEEEDCDFPVLIQDYSELLKLEKIFKKSKYFQLIKSSIKDNLPFEEMEIPDLINDEEAKLYYRNVSTAKTEIIKNTSKINLNKVENHDFSDSLDVLDTSNEQTINSWYGRLFSLLAVTITPTYHFNIITLTIIYGREFLSACVFVTLYFCMPFMYLEILIGQFTAVNVSSFFSKMAPAWNMVRIIFVINFYISGVYSLIYGIYSSTEVLNIVSEMSISRTATNLCHENNNNTCIKPDLAYYCLYAPKNKEYFEVCQMYNELFEKAYYRQDMDNIYNDRFIEKLNYTFSIIPHQNYSLFFYPCVLVVWFFIAMFKKYGYSRIGGIMAFFYISYVLSLLGLLFKLLLSDSLLNYLTFLVSSKPNMFIDVAIEIWIVAFYQMVKIFKSGQGVVMKISSYFPTNTNSTNIAFIVCGINFSLLLLHIIVWFKFFENAVNQGSKDYISSLLTMSKSDIRTYLSSSLALYVDNNIGYTRSFALLYHLMSVGISTYQAFVYIDLLDCELHNIGVKHNRYATARYKTTTTITFLFLLLPIFSLIYPEIGKIFFIIEETLNFEIFLCLWQLSLIIVGVGYNKIHLVGSAKFLTHLYKFFLGKYFTFCLIPGLVLLLSVTLEREILVEWQMFIRETTDPFYNNLVNLFFVWLLRFCMIIWPFFQMLRNTFNGKKSTFAFICQLPMRKR
ncbi:Sodium:neurotransmitter symporter family-containing protein [Strongyloides ratti]|uniref:Sodium:neurotransmitter symporter family-containing protein n=1 Tax=Strongyloides ratti TaxID=34506 RepID=A0A090LEQ3_STRRB|nr:Sodium:neurotransmitter symporter family-containing protein [Strongyloides ratti]CEF66633.1 Sodium:neurotransmitter symporter family-containing protein [Strongyloides ratti]